jgi:hypothetical protein
MSAFKKISNQKKSIFKYSRKDDIQNHPSSDLSVEGDADAAEAVVGRGGHLTRAARPMSVRVRVVVPEHIRHTFLLNSRVQTITCRLENNEYGKRA